ncbi:MAG: histidine phosphatase family protein [Dehalococcoidia bacterium]
MRPYRASRELVRLLLIRHAESTGNAESRLQGRRNFPLTPHGERQAESLAHRLQEMDVSAVYASPLLRAMQTAEYVAAACGVAVTSDARIQEYDFGEAVSGLTWDVIRERHPDVIAAMRTNDSAFPRYPGEEGRGVFSQRVAAALAEIRERHSNAHAVAVVTHAGPIVVHIMDVVGRSYARPIPFTIDNASITTIACDKPESFAGAVVIGINDTCHLRDLAATLD